MRKHKGSYMDLNQNVNENVDTGTLRIHLTNESNGTPVQGAKISISYTGNPSQTIEEVSADDSGNSEELTLNAPPLEYSMEPSEEQPYAEYTIRVQAPGYRDITVSAINVLPGETAIQNVRMEAEDAPGDRIDMVVIAAHTLYAEYPPKIPEDEIKPMNESGEIVLSRVVIPEYIVVHDGAPGDTTASDYYIRYRDYIKNVASSEIYATWPDAAIRANVLAIMSFTLNRVYTEWYRGKGYNFTITSSTAYDHKFIYGRNYFQSISRVVDEMFENYLSRPNVRQPILTQYCDGQRVTCPNWMSQWGSKYLGDQGYSAIDILRNYYGNDMYINTAQGISGIPASWPGYNLSIGSSGEKVRQLQEQLQRISQAYPAIPSITADGIYGNRTKEAVAKFQSVFGLPATGVVDYPTWYRISDIYVAVSRIAELR
ncbi:MAG: peptidoglycan-binding protein [Agathobacter sp.]|jgi:peptidoglycan hydrolase-like protein with peptidoglycan-binding domain|nr:peptidoglycan-binding protein [Lachnospiraceae bacterium]MDY2619636.1 peptidoglycan-binding protein [Agathobacter sp.]